MKEIFRLTNKYIVTATPLILFTLISSIYLAIGTGNGNVINTLVAFVLFILMTAAFIAGWFKMVKAAAEESDSNEPNSIIKQFVPGVGEYFLPVLGLMFVSFLLSVILLVAAYYIGMHSIGNPNISVEEFSKALTNTEVLKTFLSGLSSEQLMKISLWNMFLLGITSFNWFLIMFFVPSLFYESKNPFKAFFISLKNLFSKYFIKNVGLYLLLFSLYFIISIFSALFAGNVFLNFVMTLVNFYFLCAVANGVFIYYRTNFISPKLGKNVDTYI